MPELAQRMAGALIVGVVLWVALAQFDWPDVTVASSTPAVAPSVTQPTLTPIPQTLPSQITVPHCNQNWSQEIKIPFGYTVHWDFATFPVKTLAGKNNRETLHRGDANVQAATVRFCTDSPAHANRPMALRWTSR